MSTEIGALDALPAATRKVDRDEAAAGYAVVSAASARGVGARPKASASSA